MSSTSYPANRLSRDRAALVLVDHQVGLVLGVQDHDQEAMRRNLLALAKAAKAYDLPVVLTTSAEDGPNGPLLPELRALLPDAPLVRRPGEIDAFDNDEFAATVRDLGRDQLIIAGISTDVCVSFAALSAIASGYEVHAITDASGTWSALAADASINRMRDAGVTINNTVAVAAELQRDWREPGGQELAELMAGHAIPFYSSLVAFAMQAAEKAEQSVSA
jgi:nicotinamidase-related amidase